jgi:hypothetical protein
MTFETVISPIFDDKINSHIKESEIWKKAYKPDELTEKVKRMHPTWYVYTIQFDGLKPIQMTKMKEI